MGDGVRDSAAVFAQNDTGTYSAEAARFQGSNAHRLGATGSVVVLSDRGFLTRWLDDSSGTVKVADYPDVQVNAENHPIAHTDSHGIALMPRLRSFEYNHISMEQADLQLDEQIGSVQVDARPACRRGVLIDLPVHSTRGALLTIGLKDGSQLPAGATVKWIRGSQVFPVAMRGEVYVTGLKNHNRLRTLWNG
ncbi:MAG TPA: FimD/PapC C-terminal domain-containing protein [Gammaproteobacteria bacterium]|nr:FimD/PapC C-terminal domain-containing protein [Gammaproteobacteria bacterium]